jgi:hypothetical protein
MCIFHSSRVSCRTAQRADLRPPGQLGNAMHRGRRVDGVEDMAEVVVTQQHALPPAAMCHKTVDGRRRVQAPCNQQFNTRLSK